MEGMAHHTCTFVLSDIEGARVLQSVEGRSAVQLPCGAVKVFRGAALSGRLICTEAGPFSPCPSGSSDPAGLTAGILARLRSAAVGEAAGMGSRHGARAQVLAQAAAALNPGRDAGQLLAEARSLQGLPLPDPAMPARRLSSAVCRDLASGFLYQAIQLRPSVVPVPDRILSSLDQQAAARHDLLIDLALAAGAGLADPSPAIRPRVELLLDEGRKDAAGILAEAWNEPLWA